MQSTIQNDLSKKYSKGTIIIHWLTALLILILFPLGKYMSTFEPADKMGLLKIHAGLGMLVFFLSMYRTYLFFKAPRPEDLNTGSKFNDKLAVWIHNIFYLLFFVISFSGIGVMIVGGYGDALSSNDPSLIISKDQIPPISVHGLSTLLMMVLLAMHVVGVIKHYLFTKENTIKRISNL